MDLSNAAGAKAHLLARDEAEGFVGPPTKVTKEDAAEAATWAQPGGFFVFLCNDSTEEECYERSMFGAPAKFWDQTVDAVKPGTTLILYNFAARTLTGPYEALDAPKWNEIPDAWQGGRGAPPGRRLISAFPVQVAVGASPLMEAVTTTLGGDFRPSMGGLPLGSPDQSRRDVIVTKLRLAAKEQGVDCPMAAERRRRPNRLSSDAIAPRLGKWAGSAGSADKADKADKAAGEQPGLRPGFSSSDDLTVPPGLSDDLSGVARAKSSVAPNSPGASPGKVIPAPISPGGSASPTSKAPVSKKAEKKKKERERQSTMKTVPAPIGLVQNGGGSPAPAESRVVAPAKASIAPAAAAPIGAATVVPIGAGSGAGLGVGSGAIGGSSDPFASAAAGTGKSPAVGVGGLGGDYGGAFGGGWGGLGGSRRTRRGFSTSSAAHATGQSANDSWNPLFGLGGGLGSASSLGGGGASGHAGGAGGLFGGSGLFGAPAPNPFAAQRSPSPAALRRTPNPLRKTPTREPVGRRIADRAAAATKLRSSRRLSRASCSRGSREDGAGWRGGCARNAAMEGRGDGGRDAFAKLLFLLVFDNLTTRC